MGPLGEADSKDALFLSRGWGDSLQGDWKVTFHSPQTSSEQSLTHPPGSRWLHIHAPSSF